MIEVFRALLQIIGRQIGVARKSPFFLQIGGVTKVPQNEMFLENPTLLSLMMAALCKNIDRLSLLSRFLLIEQFLQVPV